jgi:SOS-response transcriptional repressor LexA
MFYERLQSACGVRKKALTSLLRKLGCSPGMTAGWKTGSFPRADIVVKLADELSVSSDYLLGRTENMDEILDNMYSLDSVEKQLIDGYRSALEPVKEMVYKMDMAAFYGTYGGIIPRVPGAEKILRSYPKLEQLGVRKGMGGRVMKPVAGKVAAGPPIAAVLDGERRVSVSVKYTGEQYFIAQVEGDSMLGIVNDGDFCVFNKLGHYDDGRVVLVQVDGRAGEPDATLKRVYRRPGRKVELRSENPKYRPMIYPADEVVFMGELVEVLPPEGCDPSRR